MVKNLLRRFARWIVALGADAAPAAPAEEPKRKGMKIRFDALAMASGADGEAVHPFVMPQPLPGVIPKSAKVAQDEAMQAPYSYAAEFGALEGQQFLGYPFLSELTQRPEYRRPAETLAGEMVREWIKLKSTGDSAEDKSEKLREIEAEFERLRVQDVFREALEFDGFFGRAQVFIDTGETDARELKMALSDSPLKMGKGSLKALRVVEPIWTYPGQYNTTNPLHEDFFRPRTWFVMGTELDASRLLTFVSREVPDMLKPAYMFGGLSLSQICKPYVDNWLRTRQSVSDLVDAFSTWVLKTNMADILNGGAGTEVLTRIQLFNQWRNNRGAFVLDKDTEEFDNISVPLAGLPDLQAQSQEHMSAVTGIPLVKLLGITPTGLNASSEGELRAFADWVHTLQVRVMKPHLKRVLNLVQLSLYGEIDPEIGFEFVPLIPKDEAQDATTRKTEAETDIAYIDAGVIDASEARKRLASQKEGPYASLDLTKEIVPPEPEADDLLAGLTGAPNGNPPQAPEPAARTPGE